MLECHHVTGAWNYLMKVRLRNTGQLERFLAEVIKTLPGVLRTETLIVMSSAKETTVLDVAPDAPAKRNPPAKRQASRAASGGSPKSKSG